MAKIHFLNVAPGDCTVIQHGSGHVSMIDICDGNIDQAIRKNELREARRQSSLGNFGMCGYPTNPINYLQSLGVTDLFRFIVTHPDMDHMDGLNRLFNTISVANFWHAGVNRDVPTFEGGPYDESDWKRYVRLRTGSEPGVTTLTKLAGARFQFANHGADGNAGGDALYILAPDKSLVDSAAGDGDINDASYVLLYRSAAGRVLIPGDAHDATWEYVLRHYASDVANCSVLIAPHHGRDSERSYDFLDIIKPKVTFFGCAPSEHLAYDAWNQRGLTYITSNQAGNIVVEVLDAGLGLYIENEVYAKACNADCSKRNAQGYVYMGYVEETPE